MCESASDKTYVFKVYHLTRVEIDPTSDIPYPSCVCQIAADSSHLYYPGYYETIPDSEYPPEPLNRLQWLWKLNLASKRWTSFRNDQKSILLVNPIFTYGSMLLMYGATDFIRDRGNKLHVWDVKDKNNVIVKMKTQGERSRLLSGQTAVFCDGYLYAVGGRNEDFFSWDIHRLDVKEMKWEKIYACSDEDRKTMGNRIIYVLAFDGKIMYLVGGGVKKSLFDMQHLSCFDMEKKRWSMQDTFPDTRRGYPPPRVAANSVQITVGDTRQLFIMGGFQAAIVLTDFWKLDLRTRQWTSFSVNHLPQPTYYQGCCVTPEGRLYIFGGHYAYGDKNILHSAWLRIPALSEMCWDAVLHYIPNIAKYRADDLAGMGIPRRFLCRLDSTSE